MFNKSPGGESLGSPQPGAMWCPRTFKNRNLMRSIRGLGMTLERAVEPLPFSQSFVFLIMKMFCFIPTVIFCLFTGSKTGVLVVLELLVVLVCYGLKCPKLWITINLLALYNKTIVLTSSIQILLSNFHKHRCLSHTFYCYSIILPIT